MKIKILKLSYGNQTIEILKMYIPHKEIKISWGSNQNDIIVSLPWVNIEIDIDPSDKTWVQEAITNLYNLPSHISVQRFLDPLKEYNVGYYAPQGNNDAIVPSTNLSSDLESDKFSSPSDFISYLAPHYISVLNKRVPSSWDWDLEEILNRSNIPKTTHYDPLSVGSLIVGKMLALEAQTKDQRINIPKQLDSLRQINEELFFDVCRQLIRQTHYITSRFQEYTPLALNCFKAATQELEEFIREETGHDKLMSNSLEALGCENPDVIDVLPEIIILMELLRFSAEEHPLAFTCLISFFEGMSYGETDPIADVLQKSSSPEAAKGYQLHFNINKENQHNDTAFQLLKKLPAQTIQDVEIAAKTLELAAKMGNILDVSLLEAIEGY